MPKPLLARHGGQRNVTPRKSLLPDAMEIEAIEAAAREKSAASAAVGQQLQETTQPQQVIERPSVQVVTPPATQVPATKKTTQSVTKTYPVRQVSKRI
jgi:hypothetical protein